MDRTKVSQYRYVGYSEKRTGEGVGFRGIGKLSGISVADKLIVTSSPPGIPERYTLVFDANNMLTHILALKLEGKNIPLNELIRTHTDITTEDEERDSHYTMVELYRVEVLDLNQRFMSWLSIYRDLQVQLPRKTIIALGKGAEFLKPSNFSRP